MKRKLDQNQIVMLLGKVAHGERGKKKKNQPFAGINIFSQSKIT